MSEPFQSPRFLPVWPLATG